MGTLNPFAQTPDLSGEVHPQPKTYKAKKTSAKTIKPGRKTLDWDAARPELKATFKEHGITTCEIRQKKICVKKFTWSFAHIKRRNELTPEQIVDPHFVVVACIPCHDYVDNKLKPKAKSYALLEKIVKARGW